MRGILLVLLGACAPDAIIGPDDDPARSIPAPFIPSNDVEFVDAITAHHLAAIQMADEAVSRGSDPEVVAMATSMRDAQIVEVAELEALRDEISGLPTTPLADDPHARADISRLAGLTGEALDRAFLEEMIPHHAGALELSHRALPQLTVDELRGMATDMGAAQAREIGHMQEMLDATREPAIE